MFQQLGVGHNALHPVQEPAVDAGELIETLHGVASPQSGSHHKDPLICRCLQLLLRKSTDGWMQGSAGVEKIQAGKGEIANHVITAAITVSELQPRGGMEQSPSRALVERRAAYHVADWLHCMVEAHTVLIYHAQGLLEGLLKGTPDAHDFAWKNRTEELRVEGWVGMRIPNTLMVGSQGP